MNTVKIIAVICGVIVALVIAFAFGRKTGLDDAAALQVQRDSDLQLQLLDLDRSFLTNVVTRPSTLTSGLSLLDVQFAGQPAKVIPVTLTCTNGKLVSMTMATLGVHDIVQTGSVVSWKQSDMEEGPDATFIGLLDGNEMCGRVYLAAGTGWHGGESAAYGIWRLKPAPATSTTPTKSN